jgi:predicted amidohydrolase
MKAGYLQMNPIPGESPNNALKAREYIENAGEFDLIVLPELANSGYNFKSKDEAFQYAEDTNKSHFVDILQKACAKLQCHIISGFSEREGDRIFNSSLLIGENGVIGKYQKIHLFNNEKDYFTPGDYQPEIYEIKGAKVGMLVCFDWAFPEIWRVLALKGADLIAHPANLVVKGGGHKAVPVYAKINGIFVITSNRIGVEGDLKFTGGSLIADPNGNLIAEASADQEETKIVEIDIKMARNKMITPKNHLLNDRRPELY